MCCCIALLAALTTDSWAATRAYVMNGLFVGTGLATIAWRLRERGYIVAYGSYRRANAFATDACAHPADRIVVIGHSFGAEAAARVATQAAACGARDVTMIGVDPVAPSEVRGGVACGKFCRSVPTHNRRRAKYPGPRLHPHGHHGKSCDAGAHPIGSGVTNISLSPCCGGTIHSAS